MVGSGVQDKESHQTAQHSFSGVEGDVAEGEPKSRGPVLSWPVGGPGAWGGPDTC